MLRFSGYFLVISALFIIPIVVYYISLVQQEDQKNNQVLAAESSNPYIASPSPTPIRESKLVDIINYNFARDDKDYAVVIKNFATGEEYGFNENKKFASASLYKLWVLGVAYEKIKNGEIAEDDVISGNASKFDDLLSTDPELPSPTPKEQISPEENRETKYVSMTVKNALEKMIIHSDNYSALLLTQKLGVKSISNFLKTNGLSSSSFGSPPKTSAKDIALYYEKLYIGEIVDKETSDKMISLLKRQAIKDRLPKYLPDDISVAHKTGELYGFKHDAGIVFGAKGDYVIVVLTDTNDPVRASERTANFSSEIYNYFEVVNQNPI